ncbi:hypothetical protein [Kitasatospora sp. NPDC093679]|uniref:hypothetical protein n=1 Tax=Kitasatospora sp. NPDC093679 TaxID=3154983 RepID=UPI0034459C77
MRTRLRSVGRPARRAVPGVAAVFAVPAVPAVPALVVVFAVPEGRPETETETEADGLALAPVGPWEAEAPGEAPTVRAAPVVGLAEGAGRPVAHDAHPVLGGRTLRAPDDGKLNDQSDTSDHASIAIKT